MNHVAEVCAELAMYHVMVGIDEILDHYQTESSLAEMETHLWRFLESIQASKTLSSNN